MNRQKPVPSSRAGRLMHMGLLAGGIAGGMVSAGLRNLASGNVPTRGDMLLTTANATRLTERLSEMRGAAMKIGQLLSMETGDLLPPELTDILARLRQQAHAMSLGQVDAVLRKAWGEGWGNGFEYFSFTPLAAASIGQVHDAITTDGDRLAVKIQYPGVRKSIDSDVNNAAAILSLLIKEQNDAMKPLLEEARRQLHAETDYLAEAAHLYDYSNRLAGHDGFVVPDVFAELTTPDVLAMRFIEGIPIESLVTDPAERRNDLASRLIDLTLREFFEWGLVQTDPNYANYFYQRESDRIVLLDFGASRHYPPERREAFRRLISAAMQNDMPALKEAAMEVGYVGVSDDPSFHQAIAELILMATEPVRTVGEFDFARSDVADRISQLVLKLRMESKFWRLPPADILFLHRKLGGMYMLCTKLRSSVDVGKLAEKYIHPLAP